LRDWYMLAPGEWMRFVRNRIPAAP
jgi:hypothetical protein